MTRGQLIKKPRKLRQRIVEMENTKAELKQVQELLQKERETFFPILHKAPYGIALIGNDEKFIYINPAFTNITGYTLEDIFAGRDWFHRASPFPEYRQEIINSWKRDVIQEGVEKIFSIVCKNGEIREIEFRPTLLDDGRIVLILSDITERKQAEVALKESEEKYRLVVENAGDAILIAQDGMIQFVNPKATEILGYSYDEFISRPFVEFIHPEDRMTVLEFHLKRIKGEGLPEVYSFRVVDKDRNIRWVEINAVLITWHEKPATLNFLRDVTERKRAEEAFLKEKFLSDSIVENMLSGIAFLDTEFVLRKFNQPYAQFIRTYTPYSPEQALGMSYFDYVPNSREQVEGWFLNVRNSGQAETIHGFRLAIKRDGGEEVTYWDTNIAPMWSEKRKVEGILILTQDVTARKRAEEALSESERKLRLITENMRDTVFSYDMERRLQYVNPAFETLTGHTCQELYERKFISYIHPEDEARMLQLWEELFQGGTIVDEEFRIITKEGQTKWCSSSWGPLFDEKRKQIGIQGRESDITERKRSEEALKQSEERYRAVANSAIDSIITIDNAGIIIGWNRGAEHTFGFNETEILGQSLAILMPESYREAHTVGLNRLQKGGEPRVIGRTVELEGKRKNGSEFPLELSLAQWETTEGQFFTGIIRDITERKQAEEALRSSEEKYRTILENIEDGYYEVDIAGNITFFNDSFSRIYGYPREELMGMNDRQYTDQENAKKLFQTFNRVYRTGEPTKESDWEMIRKDGAKRNIESSVSLMKDSSGNRTGFRGVVRDVTDRKQFEQEKANLEEQLRQSQKMEAIGRLAGGISHDFNNLLTVIKGYSQLSLIELKEGDPLKGNIEEVKKAADRAADLTRQLLAFSRRQILEMRVLDLNTVLRDLDKMLHRLIGEDIELVTVFTDDLGRVKTDPGWVEQIIMNLAVNAKDAMPEGGKLTIETANVELDETYARGHIAVKPGRYVMLSVSDKGVGMAPEVRQQVFEPFFTTKEKGKGTGLGLSTVYGIVKQSGGNIWVYSEPGKGTTFKIYLPRVDEPLEELRRRVEVKEVPRGTETILIVEDEEDVLKLAGRILSRQGYKVLEASQGLDAFLIAEKYEDLIHLLVTDVVMPKIGGRELADRIAEIRPEIKVLYMSGYTDNAIVHQGVLRGGMKFIQKPFTVEGLARKVREVLDKDLKPVV